RSVPGAPAAAAATMIATGWRSAPTLCAARWFGGAHRCRIICGFCISLSAVPVSQTAAKLLMHVASLGMVSHSKCLGLPDCQRPLGTPSLNNTVDNQEVFSLIVPPDDTAKKSGTLCCCFVPVSGAGTLDARSLFRFCPCNNGAA